MGKEILLPGKMQDMFDELPLEEVLATIEKTVGEDETINLDVVIDDTGLTYQDIYLSYVEGAFPNPSTVFKEEEEEQKATGITPSWRMRKYMEWYFTIDAAGKASFGPSWLVDAGGIHGFLSKSRKVMERIAFEGKSLVVFDPLYSKHDTKVILK